MRRSRVGVFACLLLGSSISIAALSEESEQKSIFSGVELKDECLKQYELGIERYKNALEDNKEIDFDELLVDEKDEFGDCKTELLLGAFDAQSTVVQNISLELLLEIDDAKNNLKITNQAAYQQLIEIFKVRFKKALYSEATAKYLVDNFDDFENKLIEFKAAALDTVFKSKKTQSVGRFVFTPDRKRIIKTLHDYKRNTNGAIALDEENYLSLVDGSFTIALKKHFTVMTDLATEYLEWKPSRWFGEDSWVYGAAWRHFFPNLRKAHIRDMKEEHYFTMLDNIIRIAKQKHGIQTRQHVEIYSLMLNKQAAYIDRDLATIKAAKVGFIAAPFVPLGMALGSAGLAYAGLTGQVGGVSSFSLSLGSYMSAANVAAASSLAALVGGTTWISWKQFKQDRPETLVEFLDTLLPAAIATMPLAAVTPAVIGGTAAGGKYLYLESVEFLAHMGNGFKYLKALGWKGSLSLVPKIPGLIARRWIKAWWFKDAVTGAVKFRKGLMAYYLANVAADTIAEYVDREYFREEPDEKFWIDGKINEKSIYSLVPGAVLGLIGAPLLNTKNFISRYAAWRILSFAGSAGITFVVKKEIDMQYVSFAMLYGGTSGTLLGEGSRVVSLAIQQGFRSPAKKFFFEVLFRLASIGPKTWIRNSFMEAYYDGEAMGAKELRYIFSNELGLEFEGFSDEEIEEAFKDFLDSENTGELFEKLKQAP